MPPVEIPLGEEAFVGRDPSCHISLRDDREISRQHVRVFLKEGAFFVEDLGSRNGTFVNNRKIEGPTRLGEGDLLVIGHTRVRFLVEPPVGDDVSRPGQDILTTMQMEPEGGFLHPRGHAAPDPAGIRLAVIYSVTDAIATIEDEREIGSLVLREIFRALPAERGAIFLLEDDGRLRTIAALRADGTPDPEPAVSRTVLRYVLDNRVALLTADASKDPRLAGEGPSDDVRSVVLHHIRSAACVPLLVRGKVLGILQVLALAPGETFSADDLRLLTGIARTAAAALEGANLSQERKRIIAMLLKAQGMLKVQMDRLNVLYELEHKLNTSKDMNAFLAGIVRQATDLLGAQAGSIFLLQERSERLYFAFAAGGREEQVHDFTFSKDRGIAGYVVRTGEAILENDVSTNPHFDPSLATEIGMETRNLVAVPLVAEEHGGSKVIGVLETINKKKGAFVDGDLRLLSFLGAQATSAILRRVQADEAQKADRLKLVGTMASSIVHDFRNPMAVIRGYIQLLEKRGLEPERRARITKVMLAEVDRCVNMTREIIDFVRGERNFSLELVRASDFMNDIALLLENECEHSKVEFVMEVDHDGFVRLDADRMKRVIFNIFNNSLAAMPDGGRFSLSCRLVDGEVEIRTADSGPGIPPEIRPMIFTIFATFGKKEGTGLGLSIAREIVEGHGGRIWVDETVQEGASFVIRLPQVTAPVEDITPVP